MSLFYTGTGDVLPPYRAYFGGVVTVVRPLYEAPAREIRRVASLCGYPVDPVRCTVEGSARRNRIREMLGALGRDQRRVRRVVFQKIVRLYEDAARGPSDPEHPACGAVGE
jgi:tRNA(Ile)-lysidine synthase TilS/MesJ